MEKCEKYGLITGRVIVCRVNAEGINSGINEGKALFSIDKEEGFSPTQADAIAHYIVEKLNEGKDFDKYHEKYLKTDSKSEEHYSKHYG